MEDVMCEKVRRVVVCENFSLEEQAKKWAVVGEECGVLGRNFIVVVVRKCYSMFIQWEETVKRKKLLIQERERIIAIIKILEKNDWGLVHK